MGRYAGLLHSKNIVHGDLTTSNFIVGNRLVLVDFGLSFYSERLEDKAVDVRLIKEIYSSAHFALFETLFENFLNGYSDVMSERGTRKVLEKVLDIEGRGRYAPHVDEPKKFKHMP